MFLLNQFPLQYQSYLKIMDSSIVIGQLIICDFFSRDQIMQSLTKNNRKYVRQSSWQFTNGQYNNNDCEKLLTISKDCNIGSFNLWNNLSSKILSSITKVNWPNLKYLCLGNNRIESIQLLRVLNCPNITHLDLSNNRISQTKVISSMPLMRNLKILQLVENPIHFLKELPTSSHLASLDLFGHQIKINDFSFIPRLISSKKVNELHQINFNIQKHFGLCRNKFSIKHIGIKINYID